MKLANAADTKSLINENEEQRATAQSANEDLINTIKGTQISCDPMPYGKVLIVDDMETNILATKVLMAPYRLNIDSARSGNTAIEMIKSGKIYDIIFMDYMMPKLDGIQTTKMLRALGYRAPIVALTADTDGKHSDMFLENGFDDLISKPIDIQRLNLMLNKLIRDKHQSNVLEADGCKPEKDESQSSGDSNPLRNIHPRFAEVFIRDALKSLNTLDRIIETGTLSESDDKDLNTYMIHVHGMKGALANLGQKELSAAALKLERYAREGNTELMVIETPSFLDDLRAFVKLIAPEKFIVKGEKN